MSRRKRMMEDLDQDIRDFIERETQDNIERGMPPEEARYAALRKFGNVTRVKEDTRDVWSFVWLEQLWRDARYGLRQLRRNPGFTVVAAITLGLGIGLNTAIFSIVNTLLFRPLPVSHPEQIYTFSATGKSSGNAFSCPDLEDIRKQSAELFSDVAGVQILGATGFSMAGKGERMWTDFVTGNFFSMTGLRPALGRFILPSEGLTAGGDPVVVFSYSFWKVHLGADPDIVGKKAWANGRPVTIVGVAPEGFRPLSNLIDTQGYMPLGMAVVDTETKAGFLNDRQDKRLILIARIKPRVTEEKIRSVMGVVAKRLSTGYPQADNWSMLNAFPLPSTGPTSEPPSGLGIVGTLFLTLAGVVLVLACVNVANLLLARAGVRRGEIAVRAALGAKRGWLIWQLLSESLLLGALGCVAGMAVGWAASRVLSSLPLHMDFPIVLDFHFDGRVFLYAVAVALFGGLIAGVVPALRLTGGDLNGLLREIGRTTTAGGHGFRKGLVAGQVGGSMMLLIVAGLFLRSLLNVQNSEMGFDPRHVLNVALNPSLAGYNETQARAFVESVLERARALPGIQSAGLAVTVPMGGNNMGAGIAIPGEVAPPGKQAPSAGYNLVSPGYFETLGIRLLHGRGITDMDRPNSTRVAVINQIMAERFWPGKQPIGEHFSLEDDPAHTLEVVGVVSNSRTADLISPQGPFFYMAFAQKPVLPVTLQVRTYGKPQAKVSEIFALINSLAPGMPLVGAQTMTDALNTPNGLWLFQLGAGLAAAMGILGLILAVVGVYGVVTYMTEQRTHEIGMRVALGALPGDILRMVLHQGMSIVAIGAVAGMIMAYGVARLLGHLLVGVSSSDPVTYAGIALLLALVAFAACYIPARRATKVDPMVALRHE